MKRIFKNAVVVTMNQENEVITNGQVELDDNIITLSTCTSDAKRRVVDHAKLVSNTEMPR